MEIRRACNEKIKTNISLTINFKNEKIISYLLEYIIKR